MAQSGGRGWFRRRTHADDVPEAVNSDELDTGSADPASDHDVAATDTQRVTPPTPVIEGGSELASGGTAGPLRESPGTNNDVNLLPSAASNDSTPPPRVDWDAATAAALADDTAASPSSAQTPLPADPLLEEIIREIVGDAAVDTVESLQPRTPQQADTSGAGDPAPADLEVGGTRTISPDQATAPEAPRSPGSGARFDRRGRRCRNRPSRRRGAPRSGRCSESEVRAARRCPGGWRTARRCPGGWRAGGCCSGRCCSGRCCAGRYCSGRYCAGGPCSGCLCSDRYCAGPCC